MGVRQFSFQNHGHFLRLGILTLLCIFSGISPAQIILTEIMFDADTLESHNEFVEIYNLSDQMITLQGWQIGDSLEMDLITDAGNGMQLNPQQYGVILDASYFANSTTYDTLIPDSALIITIEDGSFGRSGWSNSVSEPVILKNSQDEIIQKYNYSLNNAPGFSDEKRLLQPDNSAANWANTLLLHGTPGFTNSVAPKVIDLALDSMLVKGDSLIAGEPVEINLQIVNKGILPVSDFEYKIFNDQNQNKTVEPSEIIITNQIYENLAAGDSITVEIKDVPITSGWMHLGASIECSGDGNTSNNSFLLEIFIKPAEAKLVINEIMFAPFTGYSEWIEIFNTGTESYNLKNHCFADAQDTVLVTAEDFEITAGQYLVLSKDSAAITEYALFDKPLLTVCNFPALNNGNDFLRLFDPQLNTVDQVAYEDDWFGYDVENGVSLERIRSDISSMIPENWGACVAESGHTAAEQNSLFINKYSTNSEINIQPNPFSPDDDGFEDVALIEYLFPFTRGFLTVDIFDILGRRIRRLKSKLPVGQSGQLIWDGRDKNDVICRMGLYIVLIRIMDDQGKIYKDVKKSVALVKR